MGKNVAPVAEWRLSSVFWDIKRKTFTFQQAGKRTGRERERGKGAVYPDGCCPLSCFANPEPPHDLGCPYSTPSPPHPPQTYTPCFQMLALHIYIHTPLRVQ